MLLTHDATPRTSNESMSSTASAAARFPPNSPRKPKKVVSDGTNTSSWRPTARRGTPKRSKSDGGCVGLDDNLNLSGHSCSSSHHGTNYHTLKVCKLCTKKPLRVTQKDVHGAAECHNLGDNGLIELIHSIRNEKIYDNNHGAPSVELDQADDIVARALERTQEIQAEREANFTASDMSVFRGNLEAMGKFEWDELKIGALLGVGGFSNVSEVSGFRLNSSGSSASHRTSSASADAAHSNNQHSLPMPETSANEYGGEYTKKERVARKFLEKHAIRATPAVTSAMNSSTSSLPFGSSHSTTSSTRSVGDSSSKGDTVSYRYALKHLRPGLKDVYDKRTFNCAAVDLIWEAQFLLSVQHPNIIKLRGFAAAGPPGYRSGKHNGYFLILDKLPETMEQKLVAWRKRVKKYKAVKNSLVSKMLLKKNREVASNKLDELLEERYHVAYEICGAMEYLHERRMINRDLKIANLGFDVRGDVKLFDFGLSRWLPTSLLRNSVKTREAVLEETFHMSSVGTRMYMAPEVILRQPYSTRADVYSFGIVLWEMLALSDPTSWCVSDDTASAVEKMAPKMPERMPLCPCWPEELQETMKRCLSVQPNERPSFTDIRKMFREDLFITVQDEGVNIDSTRYSVNDSLRPDFYDDDTAPNSTRSDILKYASDDDVRSGALLGPNTDTDDDDEEEDEVADLDASNKVEDCVQRRRSTHVLNFQDLSWMSSGSIQGSFRVRDATPGAVTVSAGGGEKIAVIEESPSPRSSDATSN